MSADTRLTDPLTSHHARDIAMKSARVAHLIENTLKLAGHPLTADTIEDYLSQLLTGQHPTGQRIRTVLKENEGGAFIRLDKTGTSRHGNPSHLWALNRRKQ